MNPQQNYDTHLDFAIAAADELKARKEYLHEATAEYYRAKDIYDLASMNCRKIDGDNSALSGGDIINPKYYANIQILSNLKLICREFNVQEAQLRLKRRVKETYMPRHAFYYILSQTTKLSLADIGRTLGLNAHHTSVMHSVNVCRDEIRTGSEFGLKLAKIMKGV